MSAHGPAKRPCGSCPYRLDTPSGVWATEEYEKLPQYDNPTPFQPPAAFYCHQQTGRLCAGWVGCHDMQESLGLRMAIMVGGGLDEEDVEAALDYVSPVPLFESGAAAAEHGLAEVATPGTTAQRAINRLVQQRDRRSTKGTHGRE